MDASILPRDDIIQAFFDVQLLSHFGQSVAALQTLATMQKKIDILKVLATFTYIYMT